MKKRLIVLVLLMGIGFASIATTLYINGKANITNADFEVIFTSANLDGSDITSTGISENRKSITYQTGVLSTLGDTSVLNFTVKNNSPMYDATVSVTCASEGENNEYYMVTPLIDGKSSTTIEAMHTKVGTVTVALTKVSTSTISEPFTCTINAKAIERTTVGEEPGFEPLYFAFGDVTTSSPMTAPEGKNVYAALDSQGNPGICINRRGVISCFQANSEEYERKHLQEVFSDVSCSVDSDVVSCDDSDFYCSIRYRGYVLACKDYSDNSYCDVFQDGSLRCFNDN